LPVGEARPFDAGGVKVGGSTWLPLYGAGGVWQGVVVVGHADEGKGREDRDKDKSYPPRSGHDARDDKKPALGAPGGQAVSEGADPYLSAGSHPHRSRPWLEPQRSISLSFPVAVV
jgi:hypothetical protein